MHDWTAKTILITGAGSGLGLALARLFAKEGASLILTDINQGALANTVAELRLAVMLHRVADVASKSDWQSLVAEIRKITLCVDVLINNAGIAAHDYFDQMPEVMFERVMDVNFNGVVYGCRYMMPLLEASERGMIVNISSIFGLIATPVLTPYHASKFAVRGFTESLRQDMLYSQKNIDVVCVIPGGIRTNIARHSETSRGDLDRFSEHFNRVAMTSAEKAAGVIEQGMRNRHFRVLVGPDSVLVSLLVRLMPELYFRVFNFLYRVRKLLPER